jgi:mRNA interferase MazF
VELVAEAGPRRGDVYLISLDPTTGREIKKTRPCVIISPDELNEHLSTFLVAPMTTGGHLYPFRIACRFEKKDGFVVLDQLRTVDHRRLVKKLGRLTPTTLSKALGVLREMFAE